MSPDNSDSTSNKCGKSNPKSRPKKTHRNYFPEKRDPLERKWGPGIKWKTLPDLIGQSSNIPFPVKGVYWYLWTLLPCDASVRELASNLGMRQYDAHRAIKELLARKMIYYKIPPKGSRKILYGINLNHLEWNLTSTTVSLLGKKLEKCFAKKLQDEICVPPPGTQKNLRSTPRNANDHYYDNTINNIDSIIDSTASIEAEESALGPFEGGQASPYDSPVQGRPLSAEETNRRLKFIEESIGRSTQ